MSRGVGRVGPRMRAALDPAGADGAQRYRTS